ncbi:LytR family transcriptional regulator [Bacillus sp. XF8]|uniref:polyisoprenyl-teichoic acid--peptidoglycan teichoic acid transferase TagU n=1 Tax=Bacillus sp. XF8 TaxID=2819289 RepID=UPI001AA07888|nr:LytR family transcriptional regulator [Bacillus sp. XF8]MBO1579775.1 LytR family transcriptional regulator [Bacillus sp. XF8]
MKKFLFWILGIIVVLLIAGGGYAYYLYSSVSGTIDKVYSPLDRDHSTKRSTDVKLGNKQPVSILLLGADERGADKGRSDTIMLLTLNPKDSSMKMVSIPRDTYTEIVGKGKKDKINHAYAFGGIDMSVKTVENFLDIPVDYYIEVNMEGFRDIVDAVGGVDVYNDLAFTLEGMSFEKGNIHLNGEQALKYTRMRKQDARGDFGRQMRQRQVLEAVISKGANISSITKMGTMLDAVGKNVKTNLNQDQMWDLQSNYKAAMNKKEEIQIPGDGRKQNGVWYYFVPDKDRQDLSNKLKAHLELTK